MEKNKKKKIEQIELIEKDIISVTECTGLMPALPDSASEEKAIKDIYGIP